VAAGRTRIIGAQQHAVVERINAYASHTELSETHMSQQSRGEVEKLGGHVDEGRDTRVARPEH